MGYRTPLALVLALVASVSVVPAGAESRSVGDARDSSGRLDLRVLSHSASKSGRVLQHTIETQGPWINRRLHCNKPDCRGYLTLWFTTDREEEWEERALHVHHRDGRLRADMTGYKYDEECMASMPALVCDQRAWYVGPVDFHRPNARTIEFSFPRRMLGRDVNRYGWRVHMFFRRDRKCRGRSSYDYYRDDYSCTDIAPEGWPRYIYHRPR